MNESLRDAEDDKLTSPVTQSYQWFEGYRRQEDSGYIWGAEEMSKRDKERERGRISLYKSKALVPLGFSRRQLCLLLSALVSA